MKSVGTYKNKKKSFYSEYMSNGKVLEKIKAKTENYTSHKKEIEIFRMKEGLVYLTLTGHIEAKTDRGKQYIAYITGLCKWLAKQR